MALTQDEILRLRMHHQRMSAPVEGTPADTVRWLGAVQAQDFAGAKWGLGLRLQDATDAQVEKAFTDGLILRTHLMRPTWHFVTPEDIRWLLALTAPRVKMAMQSFWRQRGIDEELLKRCNCSIEQALRGGEVLTRDELREILEQDGIAVQDGQQLANLVMNAELDGLVCSGPRKGKQFSYMLLEERVPPAKALSREEALAELAGRFFTSRGPATERDFAKWSGLTLTDARKGLEAVKNNLTRDGEHWMVEPPPISGDARDRTHLISIFDEYISGYQDHSDVLALEYTNLLGGFGNGLVNIMVLDGRVVGAWRHSERSRAIRIELFPFRAMTDSERDLVNSSAQKYGGFFGKSVEIDFYDKDLLILGDKTRKR